MAKKYETTEVLFSEDDSTDDSTKDFYNLCGNNLVPLNPCDDNPAPVESSVQSHSQFQNIDPKSNIHSATNPTFDDIQDERIRYLSIYDDCIDPGIIRRSRYIIRDDVSSFETRSSDKPSMRRRTTSICSPRSVSVSYQTDPNDTVSAPALMDMDKSGENISENKFPGKDCTEDTYEIIKHRGRRFRISKSHNNGDSKSGNSQKISNICRQRVPNADTLPAINKVNGPDTTKHEGKDAPEIDITCPTPTLSVLPTDSRSPIRRRRDDKYLRSRNKASPIDDRKDETAVMTSFRYLPGSLSPGLASPDVLTPSTLTPGNTSPLSSCSSDAFFPKSVTPLMIGSTDDMHHLSCLSPNALQKQKNLPLSANAKTLKVNDFQVPSSQSKFVGESKKCRRKSEQDKNVAEVNKKLIELYLKPGKIERNNLLPPLQIRDSATPLDNFDHEERFGRLEKTQDRHRSEMNIYSAVQQEQLDSFQHSDSNKLYNASNMSLDMSAKSDKNTSIILQEKGQSSRNESYKREYGNQVKRKCSTNYSMRVKPDENLNSDWKYKVKYNESSGPDALLLRRKRDGKVSVSMNDTDYQSGAFEYEKANDVSLIQGRSSRTSQERYFENQETVTRIAEKGEKRHVLTQSNTRRKSSGNTPGSVPPRKKSSGNYDSHVEHQNKKRKQVSDRKTPVVYNTRSTKTKTLTAKLDISKQKRTLEKGQSKDSIFSIEFGSRASQLSDASSTEVNPPTPSSSSTSHGSSSKSSV